MPWRGSCPEPRGWRSCTPRLATPVSRRSPIASRLPPTPPWSWPSSPPPCTWTSPWSGPSCRSARHRRRVRQARPGSARSDPGGGGGRGQQGVRQGPVPAPRHSHGAVRGCPQPGRGGGGGQAVRPAGGVQGGRAGGRQGRRGVSQPGPGRRGAGPVLRGTSLRVGRRAGAGRGVPRGQRGVVHGADGRHHHPPPGLGPRLQAAWRRRRRPQHRRHGCGLVRCPCRRVWARPSCGTSCTRR